jgi:acylphosphatase
MGHTRVVEGKHLLIHGDVQGVSYRYSMRNAARSLNITGWCRNLRDGSVEAQVWGGPQSMVQMLAWCEQGPPMAQVERIQCVDLPVDPVEGVPPSFQIL